MTTVLNTSIAPTSMPAIPSPSADIHAELQTLLQQARQTCDISGPTSSSCAAAWDAVEEVQAAIAHARVKPKTSFERYCEEFPEADECRIYDV